MLNVAVRSLLLLLAVLRVTRFVTTDYLGEWWIVGPAKAWAVRHEGGTIVGEVTNASGQVVANTRDDKPDWRNGWRSKLVKGLDCPFCVGFWLGAIVLVVASLPLPGPLSSLRKLAISTFALNYLVGHVGTRIDH